MPNEIILVCAFNALLCIAFWAYTFVVNPKWGRRTFHFMQFWPKVLLSCVFVFLATLLQVFAWVVFVAAPELYFFVGICVFLTMVIYLLDKFGDNIREVLKRK